MALADCGRPAKTGEIRMTLTEMRYIVALARERHFGKAADACHISQPTLSVALKKVEGQLGAALFERTASDVRITALGERIVAQARRVRKLRSLHWSDRSPRCGDRFLTPTQSSLAACWSRRRRPG